MYELHTAQEIEAIWNRLVAGEPFVDSKGWRRTLKRTDGEYPFLFHPVGTPVHIAAEPL
jgi:hypothetical protein